jgi:two-component system LytT family response regulator
MIKTILIDDEAHCLDTLSILINDYCPEVEIVDQCMSAKKALLSIEKYHPDLVFLDIEMPTMNGFEMLQQFDHIPFAVVFTTGYDQYAIKAIHFSALDYLLKPIDPKELVAAVRKTEELKRPPTAEQFKMLLDHLENNMNGFTKIAVPTAEGFELVPADELIYCEARDNYTFLHLRNKNKLVACRTLKDVESQVQDFSYFIRVHHSYLVNLNEVSKYVRGEGGYLVMSDGTTINVSRSRKDYLMKKLGRE